MRRFVETVFILVFLSLSWYGAEMLLYGFCQMSIVKAIVIVCISLSLSGRMEKQQKLKEGIANAIMQGIKKGMEESGNGKAQND